MYKNTGLLVYQNHDEEGIIEIVDTDGVRALHFGSSSRQSTMLLEDPERLHSLYARAMMALLLFNDDPKNILMVGLGGGTVAKYLLKQFPACRIRVVEFRRGVLKIARSFFGLPLDARLKIKIGCGAQYVDQQSRLAGGQYDLIIIDAFDDEKMDPEVGRERFFDGCKTLLTSDGILLINLWGTHKAQFQEVTWNLGRVFDWRMLFLPVRKRGNVIGFAFASDFVKPSFRQMQHKAAILEQRYGFEFSNFVRDFKRNNMKMLQRVVKL